MLKDRSFERTVLGPYILAWQDWLEFRRIAEKTRTNYEQDLAIVAKAYPRKAPGDFTPSDVMAACNLFPAKARDVRTASVKSFFTWATLMDVIERNPFDKIPSIRQRGRRKDYDIFTEGEVDALLSLPIADGALMGILFETGIRKAEARNLQVRRLVLSAAGVTDGSASDLSGRGLGGSIPPSETPAAESTGELTVIGGKGDKDRTVQFGSHKGTTARYCRACERENERRRASVHR